MPRNEILSALFFAVATLAPASVSHAQSAIEHHVWQDQRSFEPMSRTAIAITGSISLSGNDSFAQAGSQMEISFAGGKPIQLVSEGASWREWTLGGGTQTAEVFRMGSDPGPLLNGNTICGDATRFIVFAEGYLTGSTKTLEISAFDSDDVPFDINSEGLCGTFSYLVD